MDIVSLLEGDKGLRINALGLKAPTSKGNNCGEQDPSRMELQSARYPLCVCVTHRLMGRGERNRRRSDIGNVGDSVNLLVERLDTPADEA